MTKNTDDLFGPPALIAGEDKAHYMRLRSAIEAEIKPKTIFDQMMVKDQTDKYWEEMRLRRRSAAMIDAKFITALEHLLEPFGNPFQVFQTPSNMARDYFSSNAKEKKVVQSKLDEHGITIEMIQAKAIELSSGGLLTIDRMIANRENSRRMLRKDLERRAERQTENVTSPALVPRENVGN
jgi:hypothetical protein